MNPLKNLRAGFIATISGIEITNILLYALFGYYYGLTSVFYIGVMFLASIFVQQVLALAQYVTRSKTIDLLKTKSKKLYYLYTISLYSASNILLLANLLFISMLYEKLLGGSWIAYSILILILVFSITSSKINKTRVEKILIYLSFLLLIYPLVFIIDIVDYSILHTHMPLSINSVKEGFSSYILLSALWGAMASPYSMVIQEDSSNINELWYGFLFGTIIGFSISLHFYINQIPVNGISSLLNLPYSAITSKLIIIGLTSTVVLALMSIFVSNSALLSWDRKVLKSRYFVSIVLLLVIVSTIILVSSPIMFGVYDVETLLIELIVYSSSLVGLLVSISLFPITLLCINMYQEELVFRKSILLNALVLTIIFVLTFVIGIFGVLSSFIY
ncbi:MAG: hypothetical protein J7L82_01145 [Staphylothermus sp.]|nr:hypothetical protein [Staphylothermus sp.]